MKKRRKKRDYGWLWSAGISVGLISLIVVAIYGPSTPSERFDHGKKVGALVQLQPCDMSGCGIIVIELRGAAGPLKTKWLQP